MSITNATPVAFRRHTQSVERIEVAANGVASAYRMGSGLVPSHGQWPHPIAWAVFGMGGVRGGLDCCWGVGFEVPFRES